MSPQLPVRMALVVIVKTEGGRGEESKGEDRFRCGLKKEGDLHYDREERWEEYASRTRWDH